MKKRNKSDVARREMLNAAAGVARRAHFENGGTIATWRGRSMRETNRRREANRSECRKRVFVD